MREARLALLEGVGRNVRDPIDREVADLALVDQAHKLFGRDLAPTWRVRYLRPTGWS